jgi:hypothetical protein
VSPRAPQAGSAVAGADCIGGRAAVTCRRALLLHSQHQWPQCWAGAVVPTSAADIISQLVKTNSRRAFLVDTLALSPWYVSAYLHLILISANVVRSVAWVCWAKCCVSRV